MPQKLKNTNIPHFFQAGPGLNIRAFIALLLSLVLLIGDRYFHIMETPREGFSAALYPIQMAVKLPIEWLRDANTFLVTQKMLQQENNALKIHQLQLTAQLDQMRTLQNQLNELRQLNGMRVQSTHPVELAEILYVAHDPFSAKFIINKGSNNHLQAGQPVLDTHGLLGQITRAQPFTSEVTLITDKDQMVPVMIERTGLRAILYGYGAGIELRYLAHDIDVRPNDRIVTSGLGGVYPQGIPIATIARAEQLPGAPFMKVVLTPLAKLRQSHYILVMQNANMTTAANMPLPLPSHKNHKKRLSPRSSAGTRP